MEETPPKRDWFHRNRKLVAVAILLVLGPPIAIRMINDISFYMINPNLDGYTEPKHTLTVWILPSNEEFHLHLDFYSSEQDAYISESENRIIGCALRVEPLDDEENNILLYRLPENSMSVWVKIYLDNETQDPNIILELELGRKVTTYLVGHEISLLLEIYQG